MSVLDLFTTDPVPTPDEHFADQTDGAAPRAFPNHVPPIACAILP